jgi:hypothetical protein
MKDAMSGDGQGFWAVRRGKEEKAHRGAAPNQGEARCNAVDPEVRLGDEAGEAGEADPERLEPGPGDAG